MKKPKKQRSRREKVKYPALKKEYNPKIRHEGIDADYLHLLSNKELEWYNRFLEEENNASFKNDGNDLNKSKEERKKIYDRNNARQRCLYSQLKLNNKKLVNYDAVGTEIENQAQRELDPQHIENSYVNFLESKELEEMFEEYDKAMLAFNEGDE